MVCLGTVGHPATLDQLGKYEFQAHVIIFYKALRVLAALQGLCRICGALSLNMDQTGGDPAQEPWRKEEVHNISPYTGTPSVAQSL